MLVVAPERFRDEELLLPMRALTDAGFHVAIASTKSGPAHGMLGAEIPVDLLVGNARPPDYDAVVVVGGTGSPTHLWEHDPLRQLIRAVHGRGKLVAGICYSGAVLARSGVLGGKRATVYPAPRAVAELRRGGAQFVDEPVVLDGTVLTANGPEAAGAFGRAVVDRLTT